VRLIRDSAAGYTLLILEEQTAISPKALEALGLTRREAEMLAWVAQGKTNLEIAILCDISERTYKSTWNTSFRKWVWRPERRRRSGAYRGKVRRYVRLSSLLKRVRVGQCPPLPGPILAVVKVWISFGQKERQ
jgi:FixJ family two-component response regulator